MQQNDLCFTFARLASSLGLATFLGDSQNCFRNYSVLFVPVILDCAEAYVSNSLIINDKIDI